jgi:hypothetical protein
MSPPVVSTVVSPLVVLAVVSPTVVLPDVLLPEKSFSSSDDPDF